MGKLQGPGALLVQRFCDAVVHGMWGHQADAAVAVFVVVPVEEALAVSACIPERTEALRELGSVFTRTHLKTARRASKG